MSWSPRYVDPHGTVHVLEGNGGVPGTLYDPVTSPPPFCAMGEKVNFTVRLPTSRDTSPPFFCAMGKNRLCCATRHYAGGA